MPSLARGESSSSANPVLDVYVGVGTPPILTDVAILEFQIYDISTPAKRAVPVQIHPTTVGQFAALDPTMGPPGHRIGVGHYFAEYDVPLSESIGDHKIVWQWKTTAISPFETFEEEFYVTQATVATAAMYCGVADLRAEGFTDPPFSDSRILSRIALATKYVDKVTGRWFTPRTFDSNNQLKLDGRGSRTQHLEIPIIRLDKLFIENQGLIGGDASEIDLDAVRVYNRHLTGLTEPDDRENPRLSFIQTRILQLTAQGLFPSPRMFPNGRQNIFLEGVFGYTDPNGTPEGETPELIKQVTCRLAARDLLLDADACEKLNLKQKFRIISDKEGSTTVRLQELWLKGGFTGDPEIDSILMMYKRPPRMAVV